LDNTDGSCLTFFATGYVCKETREPVIAALPENE